MLKIEAIKKTAVCRWSDEDDCFITQSCLFPRVLGTGQTKLEATKDFYECIEDVYRHITDGNVRGYDKRGRPAKGGIDMHVQVRPETKEFIDGVRADLNISQGETIDYLVALAKASNKQVEHARGWKATADERKKIASR